MSSVSSVEIQYLHICHTCYGLYETDRLDGQNQLCSCAPGGQEKWPGYDFNEHASLCQCCGVELLTSGTRWSAYFCHDCRLMAMGVSISQRRLLIPIGRHSLMHTWVPESPGSTLEEHGGNVEALAQAVLTPLKAIIERADAMKTWYRTVMARNLKAIESSGDISVSEYLTTVKKDSFRHTRTGAFTGLCEALGFFGPIPAKPPARRKPAVVNRLVYRVVDGDLVFADPERAREVSRINGAIESATTWAEFRKAMPPKAYSEIIRASFDDYGNPRPKSTDEFDSSELCGFCDGDYPAWLQADMDLIIPDDVLQKFGTRRSTTLNGAYWELPEDRLDDICAALKDLGWKVIEAQDLNFS